MSAAARRLGAALSSTAQRLRNIPWRSISAEAAERVLFIAKTSCAVHVVNAHVCGLAMVVGPSMLPALNISGDIVAVARFGTVSVGDVVLLRSPEDPLRIVAKRVVGKEGDRVTYLVDPKAGGESRTVEVPKGHVWVQGDNIYDSKDSRMFGPVATGLLEGRAFCRVWPPNDFGFIGQKL